MAFAFPCSACGQSITVRFLQVGEGARCRECGAMTPVPADARVEDYVYAPPAKVADATPSAPATCPSCGEVCQPDEPRCSHCGHVLRATQLYNPRYFPHLAFAFGGLVPIAMAASNWRRLGNEALWRRTLWIGAIGYTALFITLVVLSDATQPTRDAESFIALLIYGGVNVPIGLYLRGKQLPAFENSKALGARPARAWQGVLAGLGLLLMAILVSLVVTLPFLERDYVKGADLMKRGDYVGAAQSFERVLSRDSEDQAAIWNAAVCRASAGQFQLAASHFEHYLRLRSGDAKGWALLSYVREGLGQPNQADSCRALAEKLDPGIVARYWAPGNDSSSQRQQEVDSVLH